VPVHASDMHVFVLVRGAMLLYRYVVKVTSTDGYPFQASGFQGGHYRVACYWPKYICCVACTLVLAV